MSRRSASVSQATQGLHGGGITLIPYYVWSHRGAGEMTVWLQRA